MKQLPCIKQYVQKHCLKYKNDDQQFNRTV